MDMKLYKVLKAPHITEQSSQLSQDLKQIVFKVDKGANKKQIKKAVSNYSKEVRKVQFPSKKNSY